MKNGILIATLLLSLTAGAANIEVYKFDSPEQERAYKELTAELRCLVCQNQDIADSNAELAQDMRRKVHSMLQEGKDKQQIADFMVQRYGDFVLYKPPFDARTAVLWIGPFVFFILAIWLMLRSIRKAGERDRTNRVDSEQLQQAHHLLDEKTDNGNQR